MRTEQELFDTVVAHLRKQGCKSSIPDPNEAGNYLCRYRSPEGHKCAIGCLISDADYNVAMEEKSFTALMSFPLLPSTLHDEWNGSETFRLLNKLQQTHDNNPLDKWEDCFYQIAKAFKLKFATK